MEVKVIASYVNKKKLYLLVTKKVKIFANVRSSVVILDSHSKLVFTPHHKDIATKQVKRHLNFTINRLFVTYLLVQQS